MKDNYREILRLFEGKDEMRPAMMQPFFQEDYVLATDAHTLICFKKELLKDIDFTSDEKAPNAFGIIPVGNNIDIEFDTKTIRSKIEESKVLEANTYLITQTKCPDCDGFGYVNYEFEDHKGNTHEKELQCPTCETENTFETITNIKTGDRIENFTNILKIQNVLFNSEYFERLIKVAELLSIPKFKLIHSDSHVSSQKFQVGETTILLMPLHAADEDDLTTTVDY